MNSNTQHSRTARKKTAVAATKTRRQRPDVAMLSLELPKDLKERLAAAKVAQGGTWAEFLERVIKNV